MRATTGAGASALPGGDEHHVGALEHLFELFRVVLSRLPANIRVRARAEPASQLTTDVQLDVGVRRQQCLRVGIDRDELDALQAGLDHPVDGIDATAADPDHLDHGQVILGRRHHPSNLLRPFLRTPSSCAFEPAGFPPDPRSLPPATTAREPFRGQEKGEVAEDPGPLHDLRSDRIRGSPYR
jgi:hypothetical protein